MKIYVSFSNYFSYSYFSNVCQPSGTVISNIEITDSTLLVKNTEYSATILPDGNWIFMYPPTNRIVVTTPSAGIFWECCTGELELDKVIRKIAKLYPNQRIDEIRNDVFKIAPTFIQHQLLTFHNS